MQLDAGSLRVDAGALAALARHPALRHVALGRLGEGGLSGVIGEQACGWRTLTLLRGAHARQLASLLPPLLRPGGGGLERLTVHGEVVMAPPKAAGAAPAPLEHARLVSEGLALLERLHADGRLTLAPLLPATPALAEQGDGVAGHSRWALGVQGGGLFRPGCEDVPAGTAARLLRLVLEAGDGGAVAALQLGGADGAVPLAWLRRELAPLLQHQQLGGGGGGGGGVRALCFGAWGDEAWCRGLLACVPAGVARVQLPARAAAAGTKLLKVLIEGGASLGHRVKVALVCGRPGPSKAEAEKALAAAGQPSGSTTPLTVAVKDHRSR